VCVIGGGEIYAQALPLADRIYLTKVDAAPDGDVFFPEIDDAAWSARCESSAARNARNDHACEFFILDRLRADDCEDIEI
ncbi:MAG: dihydrofolate reductase, partial [Hyphococcus sp.]